MADIPLFPLNVVLMPGAPMPLHIFEERYKQMIGECLENETEFGMVLSDDSGTREIGCTAKVVELVQQFDDGRMVVLVEGSQRFRLNNIHSDRQPYYVGEVEYIADDEPQEDLVAIAEECITLLERVVEAATEGEVDIEVEPPYRNLSFAIAGRIEFEADVRQEILELPTERQRLERLQVLLTEAADRLEKSQRVREVAETNGHLRKKPETPPEEE